MNIFAPINNLGYGIVANNIIKAMVELGHEPFVSPIGEVQMDPFFEPFWKSCAEDYKRYNSKNPTLFLFHDQFSHQASGKPMNVLSMFETTKLKNSSLHMLENGPADNVITTTEAHKEILKENGITKPIKILRCGIDDSIYNTIPVDKHIETEKFTILTVGKRETRKNTDSILKALVKQCKGKDVAIIAHTFNPFLNQTKEHPFKNLFCWSGMNPIQRGFKYEGFADSYHKFSDGKCDIYFTTPNIGTSQMPSLYHSANIGIQMSSAEGWDLPLAEMFACGLPAVATDCIGHTEFLPHDLDIQNDLIANIKDNIPAQDGKWFQGDCGNWGKVTDEMIEEKVSYILEHKDKYQYKSDELSDYMADNFTWRRAVETFLNTINQG